MKIKQGDTVRILTGKDRGKKGKVMAVLPLRDRVVVEGINMVKKHVRARKAGAKGQRVSVAAPIHVSNVQLIDPQTKKGTRIRITRENNKRQRVARTSGEVID
ncbi:MAG: 50S ribosomal protein L24 [Candidatus Andersenbacteria bacterium]